jgi:hypothetical protein
MVHFIKANAAFDKANSAVSFGRIVVSGQPDTILISLITITFVTGSGMTITTVGTSNTITFSSTGGGGGFQQQHFQELLFLDNQILFEYS